MVTLLRQPSFAYTRLTPDVSDRPAAGRTSSMVTLGRQYRSIWTAKLDPRGDREIIPADRAQDQVRETVNGASTACQPPGAPL